MGQSNPFDVSNTGSAVSNTENLTKGAYLIAPELTPLFSMLDKKQATATYHEWTVDSLDDPNGGGITFGTDVNAKQDEFKGQARVGNYIQKSRRTPAISTEQMRVDNASGVNWANSVEKALREMNRDKETAISGTQAKSAGSKTTAPACAGFGEMLGGSSTVFSSAPEYQVPANSLASGAVTKTKVDTVLRSIFTESGEMANVTAFVATKWISDFGTQTMNLTDSSENFQTHVNLNGEDNSLDFSIRIYQGQHGKIRVVDMNPKCVSDTANQDEAFFINTDYAYIAELGGLEKLDLVNNGAGKSCAISSWYAPVVTSPLAHGYYTSI
jgi:hypothetical protein